MIIDVQAHLLRPCRAHPGVPGGASAEMLLGAMDAAGVHKAIITSYEGKDILPDLKGDASALGDTCVEDYYAAHCAYPERLIWFIDSIDPADNNYLSTVERDLDRGAQGIGEWFPAFVGTLPNDPRYERLYDLCRERQLPMIIAFEHWRPGWDTCTCVEDYATFLETFAEVAESYPDVKFLVTHWGCCCWGGADPPFPLLPTFIGLMKRYDNLLTDIAAHQFLFRPPTSSALLEQLVEHLGADRVLYATDWPWGDPSPKAMAANVAFVKNAPFLDEDQKARILGLNACRFLGLQED